MQCLNDWGCPTLLRIDGVSENSTEGPGVGHWKALYHED